MKRREFLKKFTIVTLTAAMLCTGVPAKALAAQTTKTETQTLSEQAEEFGISFGADYAQVGTPLTTVVTGAESCTYAWTVGDVVLSNTTDSYTPTEQDLEQWISVTATSEGKTAEARLYCSKLPVVYVDTADGMPVTDKNTYKDATLRIQGNSTYKNSKVLYNGKTEIKGRGNSTWGMPKKPYKLKLDKKTDIFGMGKNKHWVLLANYSDESLMRNTLAYKFSGKLGMPFMDTVWVDLVFNGEYVGNYQLCEHMRVGDTRVDVFDWETFAEDMADAVSQQENLTPDQQDEIGKIMAETDMSWTTTHKLAYQGQTFDLEDYGLEIPDINGGYLLELDEYYDEVSKFKTDSEQPIMFNKPEFTGTNKDMVAFVQTYVQAFENAVRSQDYMADYKGEKLHYSQLYDMDALIDYWLINEIFYNEEFNKKSTFMYKDIDSLMKMGPMWDMDYSSGGEGATGTTEGWATKNFSVNAQGKQWYKYLISDPYFILKAQERYWSIREKTSELLTDIEDYHELLKESGAANSQIWPERQSFESDYIGLKNWMTKHLTWLDTQMAEETAITNSLDYKKSSQLNLIANSMDGFLLPQDNLSTHAKAAALIEDGADMKLSVLYNGTSTSAKIYVNGTQVQEAEIVPKVASEFTIPADTLTAAPGEKDIIEVQIWDGGNNISDTSYLTVLEKESPVKKIEIQQKPEKTEYLICETLDITGLKVSLLKGNGTVEDVTADVAVSELPAEIGIHTITVSYGTFTTSFQVTVKDHAYAKEFTIDQAPTCTKPGIKSRRCSCGAKTEETIPATGHRFEDNLTKATPTKNGAIVKKCTICGDIADTTVIYSPKTIKLSKTKVTYNGKAQKPSVTVKDGKNQTIDKKDYSVSYKANTKPGIASVIITFNGNYSGTVTKTFTILPKKPALSKMTAKKKGFTAAWKKDKTVTGYELQYAVKKNFKNAKTLDIPKNKITSSSAAKLKAKKNYYVRIRSYKKTSGKKYYSAWSAVKAAKTK